MTAEEARLAGRGNKSFLAAVLKDRLDQPMAIIYLDAVASNVFKSDTTNPDEIARHLGEVIKKGSEKITLTNALLQTEDEMLREIALLESTAWD